ncbi:MAG TPA: carboxypeptidase-like regulatory domain-containing protein, partial [Polyangiaceae bacterium]
MRAARHPSFMHRALPWVCISLAFLVGCTGDDNTSPVGENDGGTNEGGNVDGGDAGATGFDVRGSVQQIDVWKAPPGTTIEVKDGTGNVVTSAKTDTLGSIVFRKLTPGDYTVTGSDLVPPEVHSPVHVMGIPDSQPTQD